MGGRAVWRAAGEPDLPLSYGPIIRMLLLTCQRVNEIARARWSEVDIDTALLTVSEDRMKGGAIHTVPLVPLAFELLLGSPRFVGDDHVFSTTRGRMPFSGFSKAKARACVFDDLPGRGYRV